uniref:WD repeat-containing protein 1 (Trinotate prediction) n=1 Tax=Myxobolus squamalis TaxID=59785 RepID=A0A6B2G4S2_MYXSQ
MPGNIYDMSWSEDSKKIVIVGEGRDKYGVVISWDTGTNVGSISSHLKNLLSCDFRKTRPFAIVTAGEDMTLIHHKGPPFKYDKKIELHTNFINCVRYNKDGTLVASAATDGKINIYNGQTLDFMYDLIADGKQRAHEGGVYSISWSGCGTKLLSASGDKSCKTWDVAEKKCLWYYYLGRYLIAFLK